jgi:hypothetical protein
MTNKSNNGRSFSPLEARWRASRAGVVAPPPVTVATPVTPKPAEPAAVEVVPVVTAVAPVPEAVEVAVAQVLPTPAGKSSEVTFTKSSNITSARLDEKTLVVEVSFANGALHRFGGFTPELLAEWKASESAGRWFHSNIRLKPQKHPMLSEPTPPPTKAKAGG